MPIDPFAVLNALLRAEAARSSDHETKPRTATTTSRPQAPATPAGTRASETPRRDGHDRS